MSRRQVLEDNIEKLQKQIDEILKDRPYEDIDSLRKELDELSFELNNLYDDDEIEIPD